MVVTSSPALFTMALQRTARWWWYCIWNCLHPCRHNLPNYKDSPQLYMTAMVATNSLTCAISGVIVGGIELPFNGCPKNAYEHISEGVMNHQHLVYNSDRLVVLFFIWRYLCKEIAQQRRERPLSMTLIFPSRAFSQPSRFLEGCQHSKGINNYLADFVCKGGYG